MKKKLYITVDSNTEIRVYEIKDNVPSSILEMFPTPVTDHREQVRYALIEELDWSERKADECEIIFL